MSIWKKKNTKAKVFLTKNWFFDPIPIWIKTFTKNRCKLSGSKSDFVWSRILNQKIYTVQDSESINFHHVWFSKMKLISRKHFSSETCTQSWFQILLLRSSSPRTCTQAWFLILELESSSSVNCTQIHECSKVFEKNPNMFRIRFEVLPSNVKFLASHITSNFQNEFFHNTAIG